MLTCQWIETGPVTEIFIHGTWASQLHRSFRCALVNSRAKAVAGHRKLWIIILGLFSDFGGPKPDLWRWTLQTGLDRYDWTHASLFNDFSCIAWPLKLSQEVLTIRCSEQALKNSPKRLHVLTRASGVDRQRQTWIGNNWKMHQPMWRCMQKPEAQQKGDVDWAPLAYIMQHLLCEPAEG